MQPLRGLDMAENRPDTRRYATSRHDDAELSVSTDTIRPIRRDTPTEETPLNQRLAEIGRPIRTDTRTIIREGSLDPVWPYRIFPFLGGDTPIRRAALAVDGMVTARPELGARGGEMQS